MSSDRRFASPEPLLALEEASDCEYSDGLPSPPAAAAPAAVVSSRSSRRGSWRRPSLSGWAGHEDAGWHSAMLVGVKTLAALAVVDHGADAAPLRAPRRPGPAAGDEE